MGLWRHVFVPQNYFKQFIKTKQFLINWNVLHYIRKAVRLRSLFLCLLFSLYSRVIILHPLSKHTLHFVLDDFVKMPVDRRFLLPCGGEGIAVPCGVVEDVELRSIRVSVRTENLHLLIWFHMLCAMLLARYRFSTSDSEFLARWWARYLSGGMCKPALHVVRGTKVTYRVIAFP